MPALNSSWLAWVEYDCGYMEITLQNGKSYAYQGVPAAVYRGLVNASSAGSYYNANIKGRYQIRFYAKLSR